MTATANPDNAATKEMIAANAAMVSVLIEPKAPSSSALEAVESSSSVVAVRIILLWLPVPVFWSAKTKDTWGVADASWAVAGMHTIDAASAHTTAAVRIGRKTFSLYQSLE